MQRDSSVTELFSSLCVRTLHIPSFTGQEIRTLSLPHCLKGQSQIWKDTFHFSRIFPCNKCLYHVQVGYLLLWLFGAPYLIFSLSDVWRSCQNYDSMDYSTETATKLIICDSPRQWLISLSKKSLRATYEDARVQIGISHEIWNI